MLAQLVVERGVLAAKRRAGGIHNLGRLQIQAAGGGDALDLFLVAEDYQVDRSPAQQDIRSAEDPLILSLG